MGVFIYLVRARATYLRRASSTLPHPYALQLRHGHLQYRHQLHESRSAGFVPSYMQHYVCSAPCGPLDSGLERRAKA